jgi:hypothetical protein
LSATESKFPTAAKFQAALPETSFGGSGCGLSATESKFLTAAEFPAAPPETSFGGSGCGLSATESKFLTAAKFLAGPADTVLSESAARSWLPFEIFMAMSLLLGATRAGFVPTLRKGSSRSRLCGKMKERL